jgi:RNA polymerase sigma-70 factor (ECF subfamily)
MAASDENVTPRAGDFPATQWSLVIAAADGDGGAGHQALAELCRSYWRPLYAYIRRRGFSEADAKDATQEFFLFVLEYNPVAKADRERGRFRTFLLATLGNFIADRWDYRMAQKRGGAAVHVSWDESELEEFDVGAISPAVSADACYDATWAHMLARRAFEQVRTSYEQRSRGALFHSLRGFLTAGDMPSYAEVGRQLALSEAAVTSAIHRLRHEYRAALRHLVAQTVRDVDEIDDELRYLMRAMTQAQG